VSTVCVCVVWCMNWRALCVTYAFLGVRPHLSLLFGSPIRPHLSLQFDPTSLQFGFTSLSCSASPLLFGLTHRSCSLVRPALFSPVRPHLSLPQSTHPQSTDAQNVPKVGGFGLCSLQTLKLNESTERQGWFFLKKMFLLCVHSPPSTPKCEHHNTSTQHPPQLTVYTPHQSTHPPTPMYSGE